MAGLTGLFRRGSTYYMRVVLPLDHPLRADEPFPLSCRIAGDILGINRNYANSLLQLFTRIGFLILVTKGNTVKANRYRLNQKCRKSTLSVFKWFETDGLIS